MGMDMSVSQVYGVKLDDIAERKNTRKKIQTYSHNDGELLPEDRWRTYWEEFIIFNDGRAFEITKSYEIFEEFLESIGLQYYGNLNVIGLEYGDNHYGLHDGILEVIEVPDDIKEKVDSIFLKENFPPARKLISVHLSH